MSLLPGECNDVRGNYNLHCQFEQEKLLFQPNSSKEDQPSDYDYILSGSTESRKTTDLSIILEK